jgi:uncharacterized membrane protein
MSFVYKVIGRKRTMRYSEAGNILEDQIPECPYEEVITQNITAKADSFVHKYIFYKAFYIFMVGSIFGCYMEQIRYYLQRGIWECRAGVIWGPFSEIYGIGAVLIFIVYKKMKKSSPLTVFGISVVGGAAFEYIARLFQEISFHSITWDYSKQPFNLGGRTSLRFAIYWGILGLFFVKFIFPIIDRQLDNIKGRLALICTWAMIMFMVVNLVISAIAVNRWGERLQGASSGGYIDDYMDSHYNNDEMKLRFPHMEFLDTSDKKA